ncbi:myrosinase 1-like [Leptidea sinapis]|uniref:myrosinase 1-like n=1 Tax=Leptidea sinapis TaxID=189913 RepID=UPI00212F2A3D|nr:myrosinase 1-like [Leptidea sinapis]
MIAKLLVVFCILVKSAVSHGLSFPPHFKFGVATSAYQIEGAWNTSGKGVNIWDTFSHKMLDQVEDHTTGDVACNSHELYKRDIDMVEEMGLQFYRFSISWSRILPHGFATKVNKAGAMYYHKLIDELLRRGIEPVITMYHFDLPQILQDHGGWSNPLIVDWFTDYARVLFSLYAKKVKSWITINEPLILCDFNYNTGILAPAVLEPELGPYLCNRHILLAHAKAWRLYDEHYKPRYGGKVGIANNPVWIEASSPEHEELAELARQFGIGRYAHPIYSKAGGWPPKVIKLMEEYGRRMGYASSPLPPFSEEEIKLIRGTYDYFGLNFYTSRQIRPSRPGDDLSKWIFGGSPVLNAQLENSEDWPPTATDEVSFYPAGIRHQLVWLRRTYGNLSFWITENGSGSIHDIHDEDRIEFIREHLKEISHAIREGVNVECYTLWSLMDNFEWARGYSVKYGLYKVDFNDPDRRRIPRDSARFYADVVKSHSIMSHHHNRRKPPHPHQSPNRTSQAYLDVRTVVLCIFVAYLLNKL